MSFYRPVLCLITVILMINNGLSQPAVSDTSLRIPMFYAAYAFQMPAGDLADRFGVNSNIGGGFHYKAANNYVFGADFNYIFGNNIKIEDQLMNNLRTDEGRIIDIAGNYASTAVFERGFYFGGKFGKVFNHKKSNPNSGYFFMGGAGYIQHKVRIEVANNTAPQLNGDYKRGYDRLTGGFYLNEFVGYKMLSDNRLLNFFAGFEFVQAWTSPLRDVNFDTREPDPKKNRFDSLFGVKVAWMVPVFTRMPEKFYYY